MSPPQSTVLEMTGTVPEGALSDALAQRSNVLAMTQAAEDAVLRPRETGRWPHPLRAALAARIARLHAEVALSELYLTDAGPFADLADPAEDGSTAELAPVIAFMDKVTARPRAVEARDIADLQAAGVADADIVRLAELNAFLCYQIRVIAGLRLLREGPP